MKMAKKFKSDVSAALHEMAAGLHKAGHMDAVTMKNFDRTCYVEAKPMSPARIKRIRKKENISQAVLASFLRVKTGTVSKWEQGAGPGPDGPACQLLELIDRKGLDIFAA
jgi:putative transcriptional regulator